MGRAGGRERAGGDGVWVGEGRRWGWEGWDGSGQGGGYDEAGGSGVGTQGADERGQGQGPGELRGLLDVEGVGFADGASLLEEQDNNRGPPPSGPDRRRSSRSLSPRRPRSRSPPPHIRAGRDGRDNDRNNDRNKY